MMFPKILFHQFQCLATINCFYEAFTELFNSVHFTYVARTHTIQKIYALERAEKAFTAAVAD